jgi:hypothetical protein
VAKYLDGDVDGSKALMDHYFELAKRPGLAWLNNFVMAFSMLGGLISSLAWVRIFG